jgi:hypothetical protein
LRSPPRSWELLPPIHHPKRSPYCHTRSTTLSPCHSRSTQPTKHYTHSPNITWTQYSHPRTRIQAAPGQVSVGSRNQSNPALPLPRTLCVFINSFTPPRPRASSHTLYNGSAKSDRSSGPRRPSPAHCPPSQPVRNDASDGYVHRPSIASCITLTTPRSGATSARSAD